MGHKEFRKLKKRTVPRIRIDDQLRVGNFLGERERINGWNHDVVMAVHDKRGLGDGFEFREPFAAGLTPFGDRRPLRRHRLCRCRYVDVFLPRMPSRPEHLAGRLAPLRRAKEKIKECLEWGLPGLWIGQAAVLGVFRVLRWFARSRPGAGENETADQFGMAYRKRLRDISSDREAQQIDLRKSECPDEISAVLRHGIDRVRRLTAR